MFLSGVREGNNNFYVQIDNYNINSITYFNYWLTKVIKGAINNMHVTSYTQTISKKKTRHRVRRTEKCYWARRYKRRTTYKAGAGQAFMGQHLNGSTNEK